MIYEHGADTTEKPPPSRKAGLIAGFRHNPSQAMTNTSLFTWQGCDRFATFTPHE